jgi:hypothetical protein
MRFNHIRRREFIAFLGGTAAWPLAARAQQQALPVVAFITNGSPDDSAPVAAAFRKGLNETGYVEGQNVTVEYHYLEGPIRSPAGAGGRSGPPTGGRDRHACQRPRCARGQSCNSNGPDRLRCSAKTRSS